MYESFFGLRKPPFNLTPDPEFLYLTPQHREALASLSYGILSGKGIVVLTGDAGTGKTTLLTQMLQHLPAERIQTSLVINPTLTPAEFLESAMLDFGFEDIPASKAQRIVKLQAFLQQAQREGKRSALIVDEAHKLSLELLEEVRLFGNFESTSTKLLQIVLVGQPELDDQLAMESLRQFRQRIALRASIGPLSVPEVRSYIQHRWRVAGGAAVPFTGAALAAIAETTMGTPRLVNVTCDNALLEAFADESATVELKHVQAACVGLRLAPASAPKAAPPVATTPVPATGVERSLDGPGGCPRTSACATTASPMKTLERYSEAPVRPTIWGRLRLRLRSTERIRTA